MIKNARIIAVIAICIVGGLLLGVVLTGSPQPAVADSKQAQITATGTAIVKTTPDLARINIGVLTTATTAQKAQEENTALTNKVIEALAKEGIKKEQIETNSYSLWPEYSYPKRDENKPPTISGYRCSNTLTITIYDINKVGKIIDTASAAGANKLGNIQFQKKDIGPQQREAIQKACQEAQLKAEAMASGLNVKLGSIASVEESSCVNPPTPLLRMDTMESGNSTSTPIQPGELEIIANVSVVFNIK
ncbi:MAG: SIMPL domain-containing protein [Thermacetogeniaceae bacterium]